MHDCAHFTDRNWDPSSHICFSGLRPRQGDPETAHHYNVVLFALWKPKEFFLLARCLSFISVAVIKKVKMIHTNKQKKLRKSTFGRTGFILAHSPTLQSIILENLRQELEAQSHPQSKAERNQYVLSILDFFIQLRSRIQN